MQKRITAIDYVWLRRAITFGSFFVVATPLFMAIYAEWFFAAFLPESYANWMDVFCTMGGHDGLAMQFYLLDLSGMSLLYSSFLTTLRDGKLIHSTVEVTGATLSLCMVLYAAGIFAVTNMLPLPSLDPHVMMAALPSF